MRTERGCLLFILCAVIHLCEAVLPRSSKESSSDSKINNSERFNSTNVSFSRHVLHLTDAEQVRCKLLRSKRYISDGDCASMKPIREVVCAGQCMPLKEKNLPWRTEYWSLNKIKEWRCVEDVTRKKRVKLLCRNGEFRTYRVKVVKSCKCKLYKKSINETKFRKKRKNRQRKRDRRRRHRRNRNRNKRKSKNTPKLTSRS